MHITDLCKNSCSILGQLQYLFEVSKFLRIFTVLNVLFYLIIRTIFVAGECIDFLNEFSQTCRFSIIIFSFYPCITLLAMLEIKARPALDQYQVI